MSRNGLDEPISGASWSNTVAVILLPVGQSEAMAVHVDVSDTRDACIRASSTVEVAMPALSPAPAPSPSLMLPLHLFF